MKAKLLLLTFISIFILLSNFVFALTYTSQYPPAQSDTYVKATTIGGVNYKAHYTTDPSLSLTGAWSGQQWKSLLEVRDKQRFHIDLGSAKIIKRIYYENSHTEGLLSSSGVQNFTFWGSNIGVGTFDDLVWENDDGWIQLTTNQSTFDRHIDADQPDPKYIIVTNSIAYRYYAIKAIDDYGRDLYLGIRHLELQTEDVPLDTCIAPITGDWNVDCSDNCNWTTPQNIPANMIITASVGRLTLSDVFTFVGSNQYISVGSGCTFEIKSGGIIQ